MTTFGPEHYATLRRLGLEWSFRSSALTSGGAFVYCDLTDKCTRLVVVTAEGANHADAICKATELAVHRDAELKRAATERAELTAANNTLTRQLQEAKGG